MQREKTGFTIAELLVVFVLIAFITIYELVIATGKINQYGGAYYNTYNTLRKVNYNIFSDTYSGKLREFPSTSEDLCKRLAEYLNIPGDKKCKAEGVAKNVSNLIPEYKNNKEISKTLRFKTSNSLSFYMDNHRYEYKVGGDKIKYFIVYVDINGDKKPNSVAQSGKLMPDIVPFALTNTGDVIPMGYPIYSLDYITARVRIPLNNGENKAIGELSRVESPEGTKENYSEAMSLNEAIHTAWGGKEDIEIPFSLLITETKYNQIANNKATEFYKNSLPENPSVSNDCRCYKNAEGGNTCDDSLVFDCRVVIEESNKVR